MFRNTIFLIGTLSIVVWAQNNTPTATTATVSTNAASESDSGTRVLTVGYGTFTILLGFLIQLLITFFIGRSSRYPELIFFITTIIPGVLIIFFVFAPKKADQQYLSQQDFSTNPWLVLEIFMLIIVCLVIIFIGLCLLSLNFFKAHRAIRISSSLEMDRDNKREEREKQREAEKAKLKQNDEEEYRNRISFNNGQINNQNNNFKGPQQSNMQSEGRLPFG